MTPTWAAPGRVNLIGEHVDYNDGLVLPFALPFVTTATVSSRSDGVVRVTSTSQPDAVSFPADTQPGEVTGWAAYVAGVLWAAGSAGAEATQDARRHIAAGGLEIEITSDVPVGAGLSSSAALECAVASAVNDELGLGLDRLGIAAVARRAENDYVGAPTGAMDQLASMLSQPGHALFLDCRSMQTSQIPFDPAAHGLRLLVIDTRAEHALVSGEYAERRQSCEEAARVLGLDALRDATAAQATTLEDPLLRRRAHHVVTEIARVRDVVQLLEAGHTADIGAFLSASHESLRDDYEVSCAELDATVDAALAAGALGARMTGGGFGGSAIALVRTADLDRVVDRVEAGFAQRGWASPQIWVANPGQGAHAVP